VSAPLAHRVEGEGPELVLLNGGMMTFASWEPVAEPLRRRFRVVGCDFRGQLRTGGEAHRSLDGHVADVVGLLDHLGIAAAHLVGASFGAEVGLMVAARHPERVRSLAAITATDRATPSMLRGVERLRRELVAARAGDRSGFYDVLVEEIYSPQWVAAHAAEIEARRAVVAVLPDAWFEGLDGLLAATETLDVSPLLERIVCPVLVVAAGGDRVMPPERSRALAGAIPGAERVEVPGAGHALVVERPGELAGIVLEFLGRVAEGGR
jgi:pimeloyl-ACP methyl ester carboxylesterase